MFKLIQRNLLLYFSNRSRVLLSLMGAFISLGLYLLFLRSNMQEMWKQIPGATKLLDPWLISGTLATTAITTTFSSLSQIIYDRESNAIIDIELTDIKEWQIQGSYLITSVIISTIIQMIAFFVMQICFQGMDQIQSQWSQVPIIFGLAIINGIVWTAFNLVIETLFNQQSTLGTMGSIIGTAAGFFAGVYIPISSMPKFAQTIIKWTPAPYSSSIYRQILTKDQLSSSFKHLPDHLLTQFKNQMGITIKWHQTLTFNQTIWVLAGFTIIFIIILIPLNWFKKRTRV